jgi:hypothetical protein
VPDDNHSGIHVHTNTNGETLLVDDYDKFSIWAGTFYDKKLIACGRIVSRDSNGLLEIERYTISDNLRSKICMSSLPYLVELNRSAIHPDYRNTIAWQRTRKFSNCMQTNKWLLFRNPMSTLAKQFYSYIYKFVRYIFCHMWRNKGIIVC